MGREGCEACTHGFVDWLTMIEQILPTMKVRVGNRIRIINASSFDPSIHEEVKEGAASKAAPVPATVEPVKVETNPADPFDSMDDEALAQRYQAIYDKKPHHLMKRETIVAAIKEAKEA